MDEEPVFLLAAVSVTHQHPQLVSRPEMRPSACWVFFRILKKSLMKIIEQSLVSWVPRQAAAINWLFYLSFSRELLRKNLGSSSAGIELCWWYSPSRYRELRGGLCRTWGLSRQQLVLFPYSSRLPLLHTSIALPQCHIYITSATNACGLHHPKLVNDYWWQSVWFIGGKWQINDHIRR